MQYTTKPIDIEYLEFVHYYLEVLEHTSFRYYKSPIIDTIYKTREKYLKSFYDKGKLPQSLRNVEYVLLSDNKVLPPDCRWVSNSGRFCCLDMSYYTGVQSYILWDNYRKVVMPIVFYDLDGVDEENGTLFCRTVFPPLNEIHTSAPKSVNLEWIEFCQFLGPQTDEHPIGKKQNFTEHEIWNIASKNTLVIENRNDLLVRIIDIYQKDFE